MTNSVEKISAADRKIQEVQSILDIREVQRKEMNKEELMVELRLSDEAVLMEKQAAMITGVLELEVKWMKRAKLMAQLVQRVSEETEV